MALNWLLGDFSNGNILRYTPLPVADGGSSVYIDIHGDDNAEIDIAKEGLTQAEVNDWQNTFREITRFTVLEDDAKAWNDPKAILFAGFINKKSDAIADGVISLQCAGINEYTKSRIVADMWATVTDPNTTMTFVGDTWLAVFVNIVRRCFAADGIPEGKPKPPAVLGTVPPSAIGSVEYPVNVTDAKTYQELMIEVSEVISGGLEWRFVPRWKDSNKSAIVWDLIIGSTVVPHIGSDTTVSMELSENAFNISEYETRTDSNDLYSKLYIQSKYGDATEGTGADFDQAAVDAAVFPILVERFFSPGVELTDAERQSQLNARIEYAAKSKFEAGFTVEEVSDPFVWISRLGNKLNISGLPNTLSAGHSNTVRAVGVTFTPNIENSSTFIGKVRVDIQQLQGSYPRLPKNQLGSVLPNDINSKPLPKPVSGGGSTPPPPAPVVVPTPGEYDGVEGVLTPGDMWGDEGRNPWDNDPNAKKLQNLAFRNYKETSQTITDFTGKWAIHPWTMCKNAGNIVYGLDRAHSTYRTRYSSSGVEQRHFDDGIDPDTGVPFNGWSPFYIKKTHIVNGEMGPVVDAGVVSAERIALMVSDWVKNPGSNYYKTKCTYERGLGTANWIVNGRFYFALCDIYRHKTDGWSTDWEYSYYGPRDAQVYRSKTAVISCAIDPNTNMLAGEWREEKSTFPNFGFPMTPHISVFGKNVAFSSFASCDNVLYINGNVGNQTYANWKTEQEAATGYRPTLVPKSPFGIRRTQDYGSTGNGYVNNYVPNAGNLTKNYSEINSDFKQYTGFDNTAAKYGGNQHYAFSSGAQLYGTNRALKNGAYGVALERIRETPSGVAPDGIWVQGFHEQDHKVSGTSYASNDTTTPVVVRGFACFPLAPVTSGTALRPGVNFVKIDGFEVLESGWISEAPYKNFWWAHRINGSDNTAHPLPGFTWPQNQNSEGGNLTTNGDNMNFVSRAFSYDGWLYHFYLDKGADGVRNVLKLRGMEAFDPTP